MSRYHLTRFHLGLSTFGGLVPFASHWWCRLRWEDENGGRHEADAEHGRGDDRTGRFNTEKAARAAGLRLAKKLANDLPGSTYYVVTEGTYGHIDPGECLAAPGNLRERLNKLWRAYEKMNGWEAPKDQWPKLQKICDRWNELVGEKR